MVAATRAATKVERGNHTTENYLTRTRGTRPASAAKRSADRLQERSESGYGRGGLRAECTDLARSGEAEADCRVYNEAETPAHERPQEPRREKERCHEIDHEEERVDGDIRHGVDEQGAEYGPGQRADLGGHYTPGQRVTGEE